MPGPRRAALAVFGALIVVLVVRALTGPQGWPSWTGYLYNAVEVGAVAACAWRAATRRAERGAWIAMAIALACYSAADLYWWFAFGHTDPDDIPYPSLADALYLALYPGSYVALVLLVRARFGRMSPAQWLDGLVAGLGLASVGAALVYGQVVAGTGGDGLTVATNLAYPLGDLVLLLVIGGLAGALGRRGAATWWSLGAGLLLFAIVDSIYLLQVARGAYVSDGLLDVGWPLALALLGGAAWWPVRAGGRRPDDLRSLILPCAAGLAALAVLVYDHYQRVPAVSAWLAAGALICLLARVLLVFRANRRMLVASERDARTDALTGLANRRDLIETLDALDGSGGPAVLALYDLDGFKAYNDRFGHPAGDVLLQRLATRLAAAVPRPGRAFRIGGDEFCVIVAADGADAVLAAATDALRERGEGFTIAGSSGALRMPAEARGSAQALTLADQRMYAAKRSKRASAGAQTRDVLLRAVVERSSDLGGHVGDVAGLAERVARHLGLTATEVEHVRAAAELHDVGKLAVPDAILEKPGPLDEAEWTFMQRHTIVGERILLAAPALAPVTPLVRASHERWDGDGYPDRLSGPQIPLGARIVALCDAWDAMVTDRPYRKARTESGALAEIDRCAGTQFDPAVVAAFHAVLGTAPRRPVAAGAGRVRPRPRDRVASGR